MALSDVNEVIDLYAAALSTSVVTTLANRRDSAVKVNSGGGIRRTLLGVKAAWGGTAGHLVILLDQKPVFTADLPSLNALAVPLEIVVPVPDGQELSFQGVSTNGTNACAVVALVKREG
jgi:hypothetical protein